MEYFAECQKGKPVIPPMGIPWWKFPLGDSFGDIRKAIVLLLESLSSMCPQEHLPSCNIQDLIPRDTMWFYHLTSRQVCIYLST